jgi:hypothetical protein
MSVAKEHREFHVIELDHGWEAVSGYPSGIEEKILAGRLDEEAKIGTRTRLLRIQPGVFTTSPFVHEYWEEVYLISGDLIVGNNEKGEGGISFRPSTYACRPPGISHGPFSPTLTTGGVGSP